MTPTRCALAALILTAPAPADDVKPGPAVGARVAALKVSAVTGPLAGRDVDAAAERKDSPTIYVFVTQGQWDRRAARYLKTLDNGVAKGPAKAEVVAVWLTDQPDPTKGYLAVVQQSLQLKAVSLAACAEKGGPAGWNISETDRLTTVVAHAGKVAATFAPKAVGEADADGVLKALAKAAGDAK